MRVFTNVHRQHKLYPIFKNIMNLCVLDLFPDFFLRNIAHVEWEPINLTVFLDLIFDPSF